MVPHHLLLPDVASRRDLDDPATTAAVATAVGDRDTLDLLHALTEADSLATGPAAWSAWKAGLVANESASVSAWSRSRVSRSRPPPWSPGRPGRAGWPHPAAADGAAPSWPGSRCAPAATPVAGRSGRRARRRPRCGRPASPCRCRATRPPATAGPAGRPGEPAERRGPPPRTGAGRG